MSVRDRQIAELHLAVLIQHAINKLNTIKQGYSAYIDMLLPEARNRLEQLEADLYSHLNTHENQKRFTWLCEKIDFERYLDKQFLEFLAVLRVQEIQDFVAKQDKMSKEILDRDTEFAKIYEIDKQESLKRIQELKNRIEKVVEILKEEIKKLNVEIELLQAQREVLINKKEYYIEKLDEIMVQIYKGCAQNNEMRMLDVGGYKLSYSDKIIAEQMEAHFLGKIKSGIISAENIDKEERKVISKYIYQNVPEHNQNLAGKNKIALMINSMHEQFQMLKMKQAAFPESQEVTKAIILVDKEVEVIDLSVDIKKKIKEDKENILQQMESNIDVLKEAGKNEIPLKKLLEINKEVSLLEKVQKEQGLLRAKINVHVQRKELGQESKLQSAMQHELSENAGQVMSHQQAFGYEPIAGQENEPGEELEPGQGQKLEQELQPGLEEILAPEANPGLGHPQDLEQAHPKEQFIGSDEENLDKAVSVSKNKLELIEDDLDLDLDDDVEPDISSNSPSANESPISHIKPAPEHSHNAEMSFLYKAMRSFVPENPVNNMENKKEVSSEKVKDDEPGLNEDESNNNDFTSKRRP